MATFPVSINKVIWYHYDILLESDVGNSGGETGFGGNNHQAGTKPGSESKPDSKSSNPGDPGRISLYFPDEIDWPQPIIHFLRTYASHKKTPGLHSKFFLSF